jgi:hypothetical protein
MQPARCVHAGTARLRPADVVRGHSSRRVFNIFRITMTMHDQCFLHCGFQFSNYIMWP